MYQVVCVYIMCVYVVCTRWCVCICCVYIMCVYVVCTRWCEQDLCPVGARERGGHYDASTPTCDAALVYDKMD